jgi:hypothetical protein
MSIFERSRSNRYLSLCLLLLVCCQLQARDSLGWEDGLQLHGFLTQGYVKTSANSFFGDSEAGSFDFRELGINASYRFNPQLMVSAQLLSRTAGEMYDGSPTLDYGLLDYTPYSGEAGRFGTILGRYKNPLGFYNETRDVASTRPSIFVPQVIYWDRVRNMVYANDGGMLYADLHRDLHSFYLHLFAGKTPIDENVEKSYLPAQYDPALEQPGLSKGGRLLYEWDGGRLRLALSGATLNLDGEMAGGLLSGTVDIDFWIASAQYNRGPLRLTMEYMNEPIEYDGFANLMDAGNTTVDGYYVQGDYRLSPDWEVLMRYEEGHFDKHDKDGSNVRIPGTPPYNHYARMWTLGVLWEPTENLLMRAEYSRVDGTMFLSNLENPNPMATERLWNMFAFLISYSF